MTSLEVRRIKTNGIILSGGAGKRVGGVDKGLLDYHGQPLVQHVMEKLAPQVDRCIVAIHRNRERYQSMSQDVAVDSNNEYQGPMAGITAALNEFNANQKQTEYRWVVATCDVPDIPSDYVSRLIEKLEQSTADCSIAHDGERRQNLHCAFRGQVVDSLLDFYQSGGRAMHRWFETINAVDVDFSDVAGQFRNINTLTELAAAD